MTDTFANSILTVRGKRPAAEQVNRVVAAGTGKSDLGPDLHLERGGPFVSQGMLDRVKTVEGG